MILKRIQFYSAAVGIAVLVLLAAAPAAHAVTRIAAVPSTIAIGDGAVMHSTLQLDEPIICESPIPVCEVTLDFTASQQAGVILTPSVVSWGPESWALPKQVTITLAEDATIQPMQTVTLTATAVSGSEYFDGYTVSIPVTFTGTGRGSEAVAPPRVEALASTGIDPSSGSVPLGIALVAAGLLFRSGVGPRRHRLD